MRLLPALLLALPAAAQDVPEGLTADYRCDGGATLAVAYINPRGGASYAVVAHDGRLIPMKAGPTGSGVARTACESCASDRPGSPWGPWGRCWWCSG